MDSVKIDSELLKDISIFLEKKENRIKYQSKKHFVDLAVLELLQKEREKTINENKLLNTHSFSIQFVSVTGEELSGTFAVHRPTMGERVQIGVIEAQLLGGLNNVDVFSSSIAHWIANLEVVIDQAPKWWKPRELHDPEVVQAVFDKYVDYLQKFQRRNKEGDKEPSGGQV